MEITIATEAIGKRVAAAAEAREKTALGAFGFLTNCRIREELRNKARAAGRALGLNRLRSKEEQRESLEEPKQR